MTFACATHSIWPPTSGRLRIWRLQVAFLLWDSCHPAQAIPPRGHFPVPSKAEPMTSSLLIPKPRGRCLPAPLLHSQDRSRYSCSTAPDSLLWAQVLNDQWKAHLGMEL